MAFVRPDDIIDNLNIHPGMKAADFGCGAGFYSLALAKRVGEKGKVYAMDIRKEMLQMVASKAKPEHLLNIETIWSDLETPQGSHLADKSVDFVIISNILFQVENKEIIVKEAARILKDEGLVALIEWEKENTPAGPPKEQRITKEEAKMLLGQNGFIEQKEFYAGEHHYGLLFKKKIS